jgi:uncharacterized membrane protein (UPF0127 family)
VVLVNERTRKMLASRVEMAETRAERRRGLLGRTSLPEGGALMLIPCFSVHTAFMRFRIDVVFLNGDGCVVRTASRLAPWRIAMDWRARAVIELPPGRLDRCPVEIGDHVYLAPAREQRWAS